MKNPHPWACEHCPPTDLDTNGWCPCDPRHASHPTCPDESPIDTLSLFDREATTMWMYRDIMLDEDAMRDRHLRRGIQLVRERRFPGIV